MQRILSFLTLFIGLFISQFAQVPSSTYTQELTYFLPEGSYNSEIPTPKEVLGYEVGEWHVSHDQLLLYMRTLAAASDRISLQTIGNTYEGRPLIHLIFTSPSNHTRLDEIHDEHLQLTDPERSGALNTEEMPGVVWMGYSIHGNEASGSNAALAAAYYLAACEEDRVKDILEDMVILFDPSYNPDGLQRFSTWVNSHRGVNVLLTDPDNREQNEAWPGGRTNHFWFDLNRDWLPVRHPESQARIKQFHYWKPNFLTDHHEMGTNSSFFFQPGIPSRNHPFTPPKVFELTHKMAAYHAKALDEIGSLYFSEEGFDDFYYGKGSTYPDVNGGVGILFEQASARGHAQESENGILTLPFAARNHFVTTLSTLEGTHALRKELLDHQRTFFQTAIQEARQSPIQGYVFTSPEDPTRSMEFLHILEQHQIEVQKLSSSLTLQGESYPEGTSFYVPMVQAQYRLIKGIFEEMTTFKDSLFYDVSAWTLPHAFNLTYAAVNKNAARISTAPLSNESSIEAPTFPAASYAYGFEWKGYFAPKALYNLLDKGLRAKVATSAFTSASGKQFAKGTILVPLQNQVLSPEDIHSSLTNIAQQDGLTIHPIKTGLTPSGPDLGSRTMEALEKPKVLLLIGRGVSSYDAGEVWHLLDQRYHMPLTLAEVSRFSSLDLDRYNTLVLVNGNFALSEGQVKQLKEWVRNGGTIIGMRRAISWLDNNEFAQIEYKQAETETPTAASGITFPYDNRGNRRGAQVIGGSIFEIEMDLTHPLAYGFVKNKLPVFRNTTLFIKRSSNPYAQPFVYTDSPLLSGYTSDRNLELLRNSAAAQINSMGRGRVICLPDNPNFRAFWYGTNKIFANAIFFRELM